MKRHMLCVADMLCAEPEEAAVVNDPPADFPNRWKSNLQQHGNKNNMRRPVHLFARHVLPPPSI